MRHENLTGKIFGKLTVNGSFIRENGRRYWKCTCECGQEVAAFPYELKTTKTSCGCDLLLVGKKFNKLLVLKRITTKSEKDIYKCKTTLFKRSKYECLCDCGKILFTSAKRLQLGKLDCGCGIKERTKIAGIKRRKEFGEAARNRLISSYKSNAKKKNLKFDLLLNDCILLFKSNCHYCDQEPNQIIMHKKLFGHYIYNGIDRVDSSRGYIKDNVVACCSTCNFRKSDSDYKEFLEWIKKVNDNFMQR